MSERYEIPESVVKQWAKNCSCCAHCSSVPCDSVGAGGLCDDVCECDSEWQEDFSDSDFDIGN